MTGLAGRWQKIKEHPTVICDTGHNVGGWEYLVKQLKAQKCRQMRIVFGMVDDKDVNTIMGMLPTDAIYYFTKANNKRAIDEKTLLNIGKQFNLKSNCYYNIKEAYNRAINDAKDDDFIFIGGSSYIVADFLNDCV